MVQPQVRSDGTLGQILRDDAVPGIPAVPALHRLVGGNWLAQAEPGVGARATGVSVTAGMLV